LKHPIFKDRIPVLLSSDDFQEEFSHTVLHGRDVFAEKKEEKKDGKKKGLVDSGKIKGGYKPTNGVDAEVHNAAFQNYVDQLNNPDNLKKPKDACNPYKERDPHDDETNASTQGD
jgi:hypothetical protein